MVVLDGFPPGVESLVEPERGIGYSCASGLFGSRERCFELKIFGISAS